MKKYSYLFAALLLSAAMLAPQGLSAQKRVIKAQGHPHEYLTKKAAEGTAVRTAVSTVTPDTTWLDPADVQCWIDEPLLDTCLRIDSAILIIKFTDGKEIDSMFVWGYRWNPIKYGVYIEHHGIDMLRTVANNDQRLTALLQYSGVSGHAVGGIGLNLYNEGEACYRVNLDFDIATAQRYEDFVYFGTTPNCDTGQVTVPYISPNTRIGQAATESRYTGILVHPFGAEYGYPADDFDFWYITGYIQDEQHWQSGWLLNGFWGYYRADNWRVPIPNLNPLFEEDPDAAENGVTYELLTHRQVHGFVFEPAFTPHLFDGNMRFMDCRCASCPTNVKAKTK
jgi:hypothetical protein